MCSTPFRKVTWGKLLRSKVASMDKQGVSSSDTCLESLLENRELRKKPDECMHRRDATGFIVKRLTKESPKNPWKVSFKYYLGLGRMMAAYNPSQQNRIFLPPFSFSPSIPNPEGQKQQLASGNGAQQEREKTPALYLSPGAETPPDAQLVHTLPLTWAGCSISKPKLGFVI